MGNLNNSAQVTEKHPDYNMFAPEWSLVSDCIDGERAVKAKRRDYLPLPFSDASDEDYDKYLHHAVFVNYTGRTHVGYVGMAFHEAPNIELDGAISKLKDDIDGSGVGVEQFLKNAVSQNLQKGRAGFFVDFSSSGENLKVADNARPVIKLYKAKQIINWVVMDGENHLIVLHDVVAMPMDDDDFKIRFGDVYTELRMIKGVAHHRQWIESKDGGFSNTELKPFKGGNNKYFDHLPFYWVGAVNNDHTLDTPPMSDLARLNIHHYCSEADLASIAWLAGQPMFWFNGLDPNAQVVVGSQRAVSLRSNGSCGVLQASESNLVVKKLERHENQISQTGARIVQQGTAPKTATQTIDDSISDNSILSLCVSNVEDAFNHALKDAHFFLGENGNSRVTLNKRYMVGGLNPQLLTALMDGVGRNLIRIEDFIREMQRRGIVPDSANIDDVAQQLLEQNGLNGGFDE